MIRAFAILIALALPAAAQEESIVVGLSQSSVSITTDFVGSEILVYGAVRRDAPAPTEDPLEVIVTVEGPATPIIVRKKERRVGIWINRDKVRIGSAPTFYAIATTGALGDILSETEDLRHRITIPSVIRAIGISSEAEDAPQFVEALMRIRQSEGRYRVNEHAVDLDEQTLFRADVELPADLTEGDYRVRIFLTRDGRVVDTIDRTIFVRKAGLERFLYTMSREQSALYGLLSLALAVLAGWGASTIFRLIRP
ncbi:TIGR02186 family protein [Cereibacter sp. SYSU M97828]|nr:TIGR02186 family protein [Cereibacter flavus]